MKTKLLATITLLIAAQAALACTGITLKSGDGITVLARTIEWGGSDLNSRYAVVPRGFTQQSYIPGGVKGGMTFSSFCPRWNRRLWAANSCARALKQ